jgi:hypothetical protein
MGISMVYVIAFLCSITASAVTELPLGVESKNSSNSGSSPQIKFSGTYDPLKKPKNPCTRVMKETAMTISTLLGHNEAYWINNRHKK